MDAVRDREDIPPEAVSASVSLDGVMVALRAGEDGRDEACWREAACGTVSFHDAEGERLRTLYFARMPESGKPTLKAQLASEVAHIRQARPDIAVVEPSPMAPPTTGPSWRASRPRPRRSTSGTAASTSAQPPTMPSIPAGSRHTAMSCATTRTASPR